MCNAERHTRSRASLRDAKLDLFLRKYLPLGDCRKYSVSVCVYVCWFLRANDSGIGNVGMKSDTERESACVYVMICLPICRFVYIFVCSAYIFRATGDRIIGKIKLHKYYSDRHNRSNEGAYSDIFD